MKVTHANKITAVERRRSPEERLRGVVARQLARTALLPVLPEAAAELMAVMGAEPSALQLSEIVHRDQALAAHVLRIVNTPSYRGVTRIVSLQQAIARLGTRILTEIAVAVSIQSLFVVKQYADVAEHQWRLALATGLVAKEIARSGRQNVEAAYLCGLLHDFGAVVVLRTTLLAGEALNVHVPRITLNQLLDEASEEVGGRLARSWDLPERVQAAIRHHRAFDQATEHRDDVARTALARAIAQVFLDPEGDEAALAHHDAIVELNLYDDELAKILSKRESVIDALAAVGA